MTLHNFIFSEKRQYRIIRHFSFWIAICISRIYLNYYPGKFSNIFVLNTYDYALAFMLAYLPVYIVSVYVFIYFLLPRYLQKKKYLRFITGVLFTGLFNFIACTFIAVLIFKIENITLEGQESFYAPLRTGFYQGAVVLISLSTIATGIKLTKAWYLQQLENIRLAQLNNEKEVTLLKSQIQPSLLFESLKTLREKITCLNDDAPLMVLQLSELLSYILYDSKEDLIALKKEIEMAGLLISIEKMNKGDKLKTKLIIDGDENNKYIIPLSLFSHLQNAFAYSKQEREINISVYIDKDFLNLALANGINVDTKISLFSFKNK